MDIDEVVAMIRSRGADRSVIRRAGLMRWQVFVGKGEDEVLLLHGKSFLTRRRALHYRDAWHKAELRSIARDVAAVRTYAMTGSVDLAMRLSRLA